MPWAAAELEALPVEHRLDRYVGKYSIQFTGLFFLVERRGPELVVGRGDGAVAELRELGLDTFSGQGLNLVFEADEAGAIRGADVSYQGTSFSLDRVE